MGYTVPVVVQNGDEKKTIGYAEVETETETVHGFFTHEGAIRLLETHHLGMSVVVGDVDIEEISIVLNTNKESE